MRFLRLYVSNGGGNKRGAHAECRIAMLPREFVTFVIGPSRGIRFDGEDRFGERQGWRKLDEEMNVVVYSTDGMQENPMVFADARDVGPHSGLKLFRNCFATMLGAEDDVNNVLGVCVGHVPHLRRWASYISRSQPFRAGLSSAAPPALRVTAYKRSCGSRVVCRWVGSEAALASPPAATRSHRLADLRAF